MSQPGEPEVTPQLAREHDLSDEEYARLLAILGRTPSYSELGIFSVMWVRLSAIGKNPNIPVKFGLGIIQLGLGYLLLLVGSALAGEAAMVPLFILGLMYLLHTTGELFLSPIGLSMVTKLSVPRVVGLMMGVWFLSSAFSHYVAGLIASAASVEVDVGTAVDAVTSLPVYVEMFSFLAQVAVVIGVLVMLTAPLVKRFMHQS